MMLSEKYNLNYKLFYQDIYNVERKLIHKKEVLTRFYNNDDVIVSTDSVINKLSLDGVIDDFFERQLSDLKYIVFNSDISNVSLNVEPIQLENHSLVTSIVNFKESLNIELTLEITERPENYFSEDYIFILNYLVDNGVRLSLDDFGTFGSGLSRLINFPISEVKLDKSIVSKVFYCKKTILLIESISNLCDCLDIVLIAEGVEDISVSNKLLELGIIYQQGYLYSKPKEFLYDQLLLV